MPLAKIFALSYFVVASLLLTPGCQSPMKTETSKTVDDLDAASQNDGINPLSVDAWLSTVMVDEVPFVIGKRSFTSPVVIQPPDTAWGLPRTLMVTTDRQSRLLGRPPRYDRSQRVYLDRNTSSLTIQRSGNNQWSFDLSTLAATAKQPRAKQFVVDTALDKKLASSFGFVVSAADRDASGIYGAYITPPAAWPDNVQLAVHIRIIATDGAQANCFVEWSARQLRERAVVFAEIQQSSSSHSTDLSNKKHLLLIVSTDVSTTLADFTFDKGWLGSTAFVTKPDHK